MRSPGCGKKSCESSNAGQVTGEDAVAVERALRRAGRSRRIDEQRRCVGGRRRGGERGRRRGEQRVQIAVDVDRDPVEAELGDPVERLALAEHGADVGAAQPELERVAAEHLAQRHDDRAELVDRDVGDRGLGPLGEDQGDPVACRDTEGGEGIGEPVRGLGELAERDRPRDLASVRDEDRRVGGRLPVGDLDTDIDVLRQRPAVGRPQPVVGRRRGAHAQRFSSSLR